MLRSRSGGRSLLDRPDGSGFTAAAPVSVPSGSSSTGEPQREELELRREFLARLFLVLQRHCR